MMFKDNTKSGYAEGFDGDGICLQYPTSTKRRGRIQRTSTLLTTGGGARSDTHGEREIEDKRANTEGMLETDGILR